jgi:hypothetical protein
LSPNETAQFVQAVRLSSSSSSSSLIIIIIIKSHHHHHHHQVSIMSLNFGTFSVDRERDWSIVNVIEADREREPFRAIR